MPRPRISRRVGFKPNVNYFKPAGIRLAELEDSVLTVDEFEAIRLNDLLGLDQNECAKRMNISQPTFYRLVSSARKRIADALINGKAIRIKGGNYNMVQRGRGMGFGGPAINCVCPKCSFKEQKVRGAPCINNKCPKCGSMMIRGD